MPAAGITGLHLDTYSTWCWDPKPGLHGCYENTLKTTELQPQAKGKEKEEKKGEDSTGPDCLFVVPATRCIAENKCRLLQQRGGGGDESAAL